MAIFQVGLTEVDLRGGGGGGGGCPKGAWQLRVRPGSNQAKFCIHYI